MDPTKTSPETFSASLERAMQRIKGGTLDLLQGGVLAGSLTLAALLGLPGCGEQAMENPEDSNDPNLGQGKFDWAQDQGRRDTNMVSYLRSYWHEYTNYQGRFGYQGVDVIVKLRVRPVAGADLNRKRVGVEYRISGFPSRTAVGKYFSTGGDGYEEWHVRVPLRTADPHAFVFNAWYQDGKGNTFYDDNNGEFYPIAYDGAYSVVRQDWGETKVQVGAAGIKGKISVVVADLDFDKDIRIRYSTDGWKTFKELRMGSAGGKNVLYWAGKLGTGMERFSVDLDLPGAVTQLDYAIVYRHGVVGGATAFEFWDNNGGLNYVVKGM
jgi:hypothetical protein